MVRLVQLGRDGAFWFSDVVTINVVSERTNALQLPLRRGVDLRGKLDQSVPRPVSQGRVIAHVSPLNTTRQESPPEWHAWAEIDRDGSFLIPSLPDGTLEISAICDGHISTNGPGLHQMKYPQKHVIDTNDLEIIIGMEPTVRVEVTVFDPDGKPLPGARVMTSPNIRYGEWSATIFARTVTIPPISSAIPPTAAGRRRPNISLARPT